MRLKPKIDEDRLPFFVYGTLLPGQPNATLWGESVIKIEVASLANACLYDMGSYPMLVEGGEAAVSGRVIQVAGGTYEAVLARLDALEGYDPQNPDGFGYRRVAREVRVENDSPAPGQNGRSLGVCKAWVYVGQQTAVRGLMPIPDGDWIAYSAKTFQDIAQWWQDAREVHRGSET